MSTTSRPVTGIRSTRQRAAIADALAATDDFCSAQELHDQLRARGESIGLTTVYRNLQALSQSGQIDVLWDGSGETRYRHCSDGHHHHLVCRSCGTTVEVQAEPVERWATRIASEHGFTGINHTVEVFGYCPACSEGS
ncbi:ferric-uptake regulator [Gordonia bronchialis DSM 43247]|uniref:Ferric-uptake regulator n=1 Tax=Gordonia bronchialis (strain ATCC 25592 / DSM 43247 / BCRC 13721 / JCM 3198 / KCTC 3076 / NBRC 16047 / NCTC 10667) TaxID=526226 RepID=D0LBW8_GORB4|nr:Fur family transcriptional regulator [Gordonia bronchialis]ACY22355.1 ferric-uptake regulator [Gordonia bronchialis DSM 43247]MCC3325142.1 transcriptional repressor [Gordonia bronchialis]QGS24122.1 transcriptional repressor [Gordonia bronchialis]UAK39695.1 transcriptional repressor [Gordonia bronchialis]STQ65283.1 Ferric uptake regulation protein [Gordonia bronchialis]